MTDPLQVQSDAQGSVPDVDMSQVSAPAPPVQADAVMPTLAGQPNAEGQPVQLQPQGPGQPVITQASPGQPLSPQQQQQAKAAQDAAQTADVHKRFYSSIFDGLLGGPVQQQDPVTGEIRLVHPVQTKKSIAAGILAGALSGMMAGYAAPTKPGPAGTLDLSGSFKAGMDAAQQQATRNQRMSDEQRNRAYDTFKQNLDRHVWIINMKKLQGDSFQQAVTNDAPVIQALSLNPDAVHKSRVSETEIQRMIKSGTLSGAKDSVLVDGVEEMHYAADDAEGHKAGDSNLLNTFCLKARC